MTLPQNVADAVGRMDKACVGGRVMPSDDAWQTIREYLLSQDAELEMTRRVHRWNTDRCGENLMVCRDNHEKGEACDWETFVPIERAYAAESRLAAADALLLRYCVQIGELTKGLDPHDPIYIDIQRLGADYMTHLQGADDEA